MSQTFLYDANFDQLATVNDDTENSGELTRPDLNISIGSVNNTVIHAVISPNIHTLKFHGNEGTFQNFQNLKSVYIPTSVRTIGTGAFRGCESLELVVLPVNGLTLTNSSFRLLSNLKTIIIPDSITFVKGTSSGELANSVFMDTPSGNNQAYIYKTQERIFYNITLTNDGILNINNQVSLEYIINRHNDLSSVTLDYERLKSVGYKIDRQVLNITNDVDRNNLINNAENNGKLATITTHEWNSSNNAVRDMKILQQLEVTKTGILDFIRIGFQDNASGSSYEQPVKFVVYRGKIDIGATSGSLQDDYQSREIARIHTTIYTAYGTMALGYEFSLINSNILLHEGEFITFGIVDGLTPNFLLHIRPNDTDTNRSVLYKQDNNIQGWLKKDNSQWYIKNTLPVIQYDHYITIDNGDETELTVNDNTLLGMTINTVNNTVNTLVDSGYVVSWLVSDTRKFGSPETRTGETISLSTDDIGKYIKLKFEGTINGFERTLYSREYMIIERQFSPESIVDNPYVLQMTNRETITTLLSHIVTDQNTDDVLRIGDTVIVEPSNGSLSILNDSTVRDGIIYTPNQGFTGMDTVTISIYDDSSTYPPLQMTLNYIVSEGNSSPTAQTNYNVDIEEDSGQVTTNIDNLSPSPQDVDGDTLSITSVSQNAGFQGDVTFITGTGNVLYTPATNFNGSESVTVTISDGNGSSTTSTITYNVSPVNDAPTAQANYNVNIEEDYGSVITNIDHLTPSPPQDVENDTLSITSVSRNAGFQGDVTFITGTGNVLYTPDTNFNGSESVTVTISDGNGGSTTSTITYIVSPTNDGPTTTGEKTISLNEDTFVVTNLSELNITDIDGDELIITGITLPTGSNSTTLLSNSNKSFVYTPATNFNGSESVKVTISDGEETVNKFIIYNVKAVNDAPTADANYNVNISEDEQVTTNISSLDANDVDGHTLSIISVLSPNAGFQGHVTFDAPTGNVTYIPATNFNGSESVVITISDGNGGSTTSTITYNVSPLNDDATGDVIIIGNVREGATVVADVSALRDVDGGITNIAYEWQEKYDDGSYSALQNETSVAFTIPDDQSLVGKEIRVKVTTTDALGGTNEFYSTDTEVANVNDAPTAQANYNVNILEDSEQVITNINNLTIDTTKSPQDVDGDTLSITSVSQNAGFQGHVTFDAGNVLYTPATNFNGSESVVITISDGNGGSTTSTITYNVDAVNDYPTAVENYNVDIQEDSAQVTTNISSLNANDDDGHTLSIISVSPNTGFQGDVTFDAGNVLYTPATNINGIVSVRITISDENGGTKESTITYNVKAVNDAPTAQANYNVDIEEDSGKVITNINNLTIDTTKSPQDVDGDTLSITSVSQNAGFQGLVTFDAPTGNVTYIPATNFNGSESVVITISDGNDGSTTSTITYNVSPLNDDATGDVIIIGNVREGATVNANTGSLRDVDGDITNIAYEWQKKNDDGSYSALQNETSVAFTIPDDQSLVGTKIRVKVTTTDALGGTNVFYSIDTEVANVNDAPTAGNKELSLNEDDTITTRISDITTADDDIVGHNNNNNHGDELKIISVVGDNNETQVFKGKVYLNDENNVVYIPATNFYGEERVTVTISDSNGASTTSKIIYTVNNGEDEATGVVTIDGDVKEGGDVEANVSALVDVDGGINSFEYEWEKKNDDGSYSALQNGTSVNYTIPDDQSLVGIEIRVKVTTTDALNGTTVIYSDDYLVENVNDAPTAVNEIHVDLMEDHAKVTNIHELSVADDDDDDLVIESVTIGANKGSVSISENGKNVTYNPAANFYGEAIARVTISDSNGASTTSKIKYNVIAVNDVPKVNHDRFIHINHHQGEDFIISLSDIFSDIETNPLSYEISNIDSAQEYLEIYNSTSLKITLPQTISIYNTFIVFNITARETSSNEDPLHSVTGRFCLYVETSSSQNSISVMTIMEAIDNNLLTVDEAVERGFATQVIKEYLEYYGYTAMLLYLNYEITIPELIGIGFTINFASTSGDPHIYPVYGSMYELPHNEGCYRMAQGKMLTVNSSTRQIREDEKDEMREYFMECGVWNANVENKIVNDGVFYKKVYINSEGHTVEFDFDKKGIKFNNQASKNYFELKTEVKYGMNNGNAYEKSEKIGECRLQFEHSYYGLISLNLNYFSNPQIKYGMSLCVDKKIESLSGLLIREYKTESMELYDLTDEDKKYGIEGKNNVISDMVLLQRK